MKKLQFLILFLLPITMYSQYSEVWKLKNEVFDTKKESITIGKMKYLSTGVILISKSNQIQHPELQIITQEGKSMGSDINDLVNGFNKLPEGEYFVDESSHNKYLLQDASNMARYYNLLREKNSNVSLNYVVHFWKNPLQFYNGSNGDLTKETRNYTTVFDNDYGLVFADTVWFGELEGQKRILHYSISHSGPMNENRKFYPMGSMTLSDDLAKAIAVPVVIKRFEDRSLLVTLASEEVPSSQAVDITLKVIDENYQERSSFTIPASTFNLNGSLLAIKDACILGDYIYLLGVTYGKGTVKHPFFAKIHRGGQLVGFKILNNNAELCRLEKYNDFSLVAVGKQWSKVNETNIARKYIVELTDNLDIVQSAEIGSEEGYLKDVIVRHDGDLFVGGRDGETPYLAKLTKSMTSVQNQSSLPNTIIQSRMEIHPNPASNLATIELQKTLNGLGSITLYSIEGVEIRSIFSGDFAGKRTFTVPTDQLINGTYTIVVRSTGATFSKLFQVIR